MEAAPTPADLIQARAQGMEDAAKIADRHSVEAEGFADDAMVGHSAERFWRDCALEARRLAVAIRVAIPRQVEQEGER